MTSIPEGHCRSCKRLMRDDDYIMRRDGKGYCRSCKKCIKKRRFRNTEEWRKLRDKKYLEQKKEAEKRILKQWTNMYK